MKKNIIFFILFIFVLINNKALFSSNQNQVNDVLFRFKDILNNIYNIKGKTETKYFENNELKGSSITFWESEQKVIQKTEKGFKFTYSYVSRKENNEVQKKGDGFFERNEIGEMFVEENSFYPQSINIPVFSDKPVKILESWNAICLEIIDFRNIGIDKPFKLTSNVIYRYLRNEKNNNDDDIAIIKAIYIINENTNNKIITSSNFSNRYYFPARIIGKIERFFYWNIQKGYWQKMEAEINLIIIFTNSLTIEFLNKVYATMEKN